MLPYLRVMLRQQNTSMFQKFITIITILLLCIPILLKAQNPTGLIVTGQVTDMQGKSIVGATVVLTDIEHKQNNHTVLSNGEGRFQLFPATQKFQVVVSYIGYSQFHSDTLFLSKNTDLGVIKLQNMSKLLKEVIIKGVQKPPLLKSDGRKLTYNVEASVTAQGSNALDVMKKTPGIVIAGKDNTITLNGINSALIMINGRQTYLEQKDIAELLKSTPSSSIKSIEIISNPSAEYDATGSGGIINIITQRSTIRGFNGSINNGAAYGVSPKQNTDLNLNYRAGNLNLFGGYSHTLGYFDMHYSYDRIMNGKIYENPIHDVDKRKTMSAFAGMDYTIDSKQTIGLLFNSNFLFGPGVIRPVTYISDASSGMLLQKLVSVSDYYQQHANRYNANINYRYQDTLGNTLNLDADYGYFDDGTKNLNGNTYYTAGEQFLSDSVYRTISSKKIHIYALTLKYQGNLWKGKYTVGGKWSTVTTGNDFNFYQVGSGTDKIIADQSNFFKYKEQIIAGFVKYEGNFSRQLSYDIGLRLENTHSTGDLTPVPGSSQQPLSITRNYLDYFPTGSLIFKSPKAGSYTLSYAKRIDRPMYKDLNPFEYPIDELSYWKGNPFLQPQYTQSIALGYSIAKTSASLAYTYTNHLSMEVIEVVQQNKTAMIPQNIGEQKNISLRITQQVAPFKWWDMTVSGTGYYLNNTIHIEQLGNYKPARFAGTFSTQQQFKLPFQLTAEISGVFNTTTLSGPVGITKGNSQVDIGLQKPVLKDRGFIRLAVTDIYQGNHWETTSRYNGLYSHTTFSGEYRQVKINFQYKFGSTAIKQRAEHESGVETENRRL